MERKLTNLANYLEIGLIEWIVLAFFALLYSISFMVSLGSDVTMCHILITFFAWLGFYLSHRAWHVKYLKTTTCYWLYCGTVRSYAASHLEEQVSTIHCDSIVGKSGVQGQTLLAQGQPPTLAQGWNYGSKVGNRKPLGIRSREARENSALDLKHQSQEKRQDESQRIVHHETVLRFPIRCHGSIW